MIKITCQTDGDARNFPDLLKLRVEAVLMLILLNFF